MKNYVISRIIEVDSIVAAVCYGVFRDGVKSTMDADAIVAIVCYCVSTESGR